MKSALKKSDSSTIFYLNTKADIEQMPNTTENTTMEQFEKILAEQRTIRYELLRKAPCLGKDTLNSLPEFVDECNCFDVCSVLSRIDPLGNYMNNCAIRRLIQFVANTDLVVAKRVTSLVLPAIEAFFDLALVISHRTFVHLQQLRREALTWHDTYFSEHRKHFERFLTKVYEMILTQLEIKKEKLIKEAAKRRDRKSIELFMRLAIKHEVVKQVVSDALSEILSTALLMLVSNRDLMVNASSNELLVAALRTEESEVFATVVDESVVQATFKYYMLNNITASTMLVAQILFNDDDDGSDSDNVKSLLKQLQNARSRSSLRTSEHYHNSAEPSLEAQQCLANIKSEMTDEKSALELIIGLWSDQQKTKLAEKINELYKGAEKLLPLRNKAHELIQRYSSSFARIFCHLQAAQDLAKFDGIEPVIQIDNSQSTVYSIHPAEWGKRKNFVVKRLRESVANKSNIAYFEGQYHLKVRSLNIPYVVDISYMYEKELQNSSRDLWMFFPATERNLKDFILQPHKELSLDEGLEIIIRIATALTCLHQNELVHRNVDSSNIILDGNDKAYLIDIGNWSYDGTCDITTRHDPSATPNGVNDDIRSLGQLGLELLPLIKHSNKEDNSQKRLHSFETVMLQCVNASATDPMSARSVQVTLKSI